MLCRSLPRAIRKPIRILSYRTISTLPGNPNIYVFPNQNSLSGHLLSLLPTDPPSPELAIGVTQKLPPTPDSLQESNSFLAVLHDVMGAEAHKDPEVISQAQAMASTSGAMLGSGGAFFAPQSKRKGSGGGGAGPASVQGGAGSGGRSGYIHVSDSRAPPDYGRIAWPEDIFGSLEVDGDGNFVDGTGNYQKSGTYRVITREGILGLSPFLRQKLIERLRQEESKVP